MNAEAEVIVDYALTALGRLSGDMRTLPSARPALTFGAFGGAAGLDFCGAWPAGFTPFAPSFGRLSGLITTLPEDD